MTEDGTRENRQLRGEPEADGPQIPAPSNSKSEPEMLWSGGRGALPPLRGKNVWPQGAAPRGWEGRTPAEDTASARVSVQQRSEQLAGDRPKQGAGGQAGRTCRALSPGDRGSTCAAGGGQGEQWEAGKIFLSL